MAIKRIPVCVPKLPLTEKIIPYLKEIDENRWYTNFGPLVKRFLARTAELFSVPDTHIVSASNGTVLLELCLKAMEIPAGSLCVLPSWTFIATPLAAVAARLEPLFVDVDINTQALDPEQLLMDLPRLTQFGKIGVVMVTAPFGKPINVKAWDQFTELTGIPVLIDAAAAFDTILQRAEMPISATPMMISLHATKTFGIGEGAILLTTNEALTTRIQNLTQFGFPNGVRNAHHIGTNAKLSEYVAAVGLAALDQWSVIRNDWQAIARHYQELFDQAGIQHMLAKDWQASTCNIITPNLADKLAVELDAKGISTRKWWEEGCHQQVAFRGALQDAHLKNTEWLGRSVLGLPFYVGMTKEQIKYIVDQLSKLVERKPKRTSELLNSKEESVVF